MKLLWWIIFLPLFALVAALAVANRLPVTIDFDPFPLVLEAPLYLVLMVAIVGGLLIGAVMVWFAGGPRRRESRRLRRNIKLMEAELDNLRAKLAEPVGDTPVVEDGKQLERK